MGDVDQSDFARLGFCLEQLKTHGFLEYSGEYGAEITTFMPFAAWLHSQGLLAGCRIRTYAGMRPYYFFLDDDQYEEKAEAREWLPVARRHWPNNSTYHAMRGAWQSFPDFRSHYARSGESFDRPIIFVQNKFTVEWNVGPINFMPLSGLDRFFKATRDRYQIIYSRPETRLNKSYTSDQNTGLTYPDSEITSQYDHVLDFEEYCRNTDRDYNVVKLEILAKCHLFAAVQGGGAHILACFGNSLMLVLDRSEDIAPDGAEYPHAYQSGPYKYLSAPPPILMVARKFSEFNEGLFVLGNAMPVDGRIAMAQQSRPIFEKLKL